LHGSDEGSRLLGKRFGDRRSNLGAVADDDLRPHAPATVGVHRGHPAARGGLLGLVLEPVKLVGVWLMMGMEPNLVVDIGDFIDKKLDSLRCHVSQIGEDPSEEDRGFVTGMAEFSAAKEPFRYGEAFRVFRFDLPWRPPAADAAAEAEAPLAEA
jgi:hypothetical protein